MKNIKMVVSLLLVVCFVTFAAITPAGAAYSNTGKSFTLKEGGVLGIGATTYKYKIFKDSDSWYVMFHDKDVCPAIYHKKGSGNTTLTYSVSRTYSSQSSYSFSTTAGLSAGADMVNATVSATSGMTQSYGYSVTASGSVGKTIKSDSKTGYYKMTICYNFDKYRLDKYNGNTLTAHYYAGIPKGNAYVAVLYGTSTSNSSYEKY